MLEPALSTCRGRRDPRTKAAAPGGGYAAGQRGAGLGQQRRCSGDPAPLPSQGGRPWLRAWAERDRGHFGAASQGRPAGAFSCLSNPTLSRDGDLSGTFF